MNGMAILEQNDVQTKAIFIEQEVVEFARQNALTKKHRAANELKRRKAEKAEARRRAYNMATAKYMLTRLAVSGVMALGWATGLIHPLVSIPLIMISLCTACVRLGVWFGKNSRKVAR